MNVVWLGDYNQRHVVSTAAFRTTILAKIRHSHDPPVHNGPLIRHFGGMAVHNRVPIGFELWLLVRTHLCGLAEDRYLRSDH